MNSLITKSLVNKDVTLLFGMPEQFLSSFEKKMVGWIKEYVLKYSTTPTVDRLGEQFELFVPVSSEDPLGDIYDRELQQKRNHYAREYITSIQEELKKGADPLPFVRQLNQNLQGGDGGVTFFTKFDRSLYTRRATSHPYDIPQIDRYTGGISQGDLIYLIGRLGTGKTTFAIWLLTKWLQRGRKVLMVSNENRADDVIGKIDSFIGGWNPMKKRLMDWTEDDKRRIQTVSYIASHMDGEVVVPNKPVKGIEELNNLIYTYIPDMVIVDGIYLMNGVSGDSHWEKITDISRNLKRLADTNGAPILGLHQANRGAVGKRIEIENIAYADALGQDADLVLAINKEKDTDDDLFVECIKNRWGSGSWGFFMKFYFDSMFVKVYDTKTALEE